MEPHIVEKYRNDANFHTAVSYLEKALVEKILTPQELKDALAFAVERYEIRKLLGFVE